MGITAKDLLENKKFLASTKLLYGDNKEEYQAKRYENLYNIHKKTYGDNCTFFSSSGRIEVCGNHTDHNNGKVLCASISVDTIACVTPLEGKIIIASIGYPVVEVDISDLNVHKEEFGKSEGLVRGVLAYYKQNGYKIGGFAATTTSDVFKGAGVSSSASFELLVAEILNVMFNDGKIDVITKAKAAHMGESDYFGKPCGLLDQSAISIGGVSYIDFKSTKDPKVEKIDWPFNDLAIVITNTGGDHCNLTGEYAAIREEMEAVAKFFHKKVLRKVKEEEFYENISKLREVVSDRAIERAIHYFNENRRVDIAKKALQKGQEKKFIDMINQSGISSLTMLQNCFPNGAVAQPIPLGIALSKQIKGVKAVRVHGGGFAGTIIAYVEKSEVKNYVKEMSKVFGDENVFHIEVRNIGACKVEL
ncbi:MAG: galactokinase [Clostridiales bacterium]|nr:galactokinase [Clostridiales bacterium]